MTGVNDVATSKVDERLLVIARGYKGLGGCTVQFDGKV